MRPIRDEIETVAGGPVVVIFHTRAESARLHASFVSAHEQTVARRLAALASATRVRTGR
ncbi:MAG TPA: hypothetical protein VK932_19700 [Kofleriaceae bacterium]|nr:hypothetical protein [Kofleriaceae bacterium]